MARHALITGGSSGIGLAYAQYLDRHGWQLTRASRQGVVADGDRDTARRWCWRWWCVELGSQLVVARHACPAQRGVEHGLNSGVEIGQLGRGGCRSRCLSAFDGVVV